MSDWWTAFPTGIARQLCERLKAAGVSSNCCCLNQYKFFLSRRPRVVVIVSSTFLVGAAPLNAAKFNEFLDDPTPDDVSWMSFAVLGIGNSQWPSFCAFTRKIDARLQELGARRLVERLDGDSADEPKRDADIDDWIDQLVRIVVPRVTTSDIEEAVSIVSVCSRWGCTHTRSIRRTMPSHVSHAVYVVVRAEVSNGVCAGRVPSS